MPGSLNRRRSSLLGIFLSASFAAASARADTGDPTCVAGLRIAIGPPTLEPARAHRMLEQIAAELGPQTDVHCDDASTRIDVDVGDETTHVVVEAESGGEKRKAERSLDFTSIAEDGRPLAIAIAIDEMSREVHEELSIRRAPKPVVVRPMPAPAPRPVVAPPPEARGAIGLGLALEAFTSGVALLGPDAHLQLFFGSHALIAGHLGVLGVPAWKGGPHEAWAGGLTVGFSPNVHAPVGIAGVVAFDTTLTLSGSRKEVVASTAPSVGGQIWAPLGDSLRLTLDARIGSPFTSLHAPRQDGHPAIDAGGAAVFTTIGVQAIF